MAARLDKTLKRELEIDGEAFMVSMSPEGVRITPKGKRKGHEISWRTLMSGDAELTQQLNISLDAFGVPSAKPAASTLPGKSKK